MAFPKFPRTNFHELNTDWIIETLNAARTAVESAAQTVAGYDTRLTEIERLVNALNMSVSFLSTNIHQLEEQITELPTIKSTAEQAAQTAQLASDTATAADEAANTALTNAASAVTIAQSIAYEKLDVQGPSARGWLTVSQGNNGGLRMTTYQDNDNFSNFQMVNNNGNIEFSARRVVNGQTTQFHPRITNISPPINDNDAATKAYVDGYKETVTGTTVIIEPENKSIYQCGELSQLTITNQTVIGEYSIVFTSGATPTTTVIPATILGLETFTAEANTIYEINVLDNRAVVGSWAVSV